MSTNLTPNISGNPTTITPASGPFYVMPSRNRGQNQGPSPASTINPGASYVLRSSLSRNGSNLRTNENPPLTVARKSHSEPVHCSPEPLQVPLSIDDALFDPLTYNFFKSGDSIVVNAAGNSFHKTSWEEYITAMCTTEDAKKSPLVLCPIACTMVPKIAPPNVALMDMLQIVTNAPSLPANINELPLEKRLSIIEELNMQYRLELHRLRHEKFPSHPFVVEKSPVELAQQKQASLQKELDEANARIQKLEEKVQKLKEKTPIVGNSQEIIPFDRQLVMLTDTPEGQIMSQFFGQVIEKTYEKRFEAALATKDAEIVALRAENNEFYAAKVKAELERQLYLEKLNTELKKVIALEYRVGKSAEALQTSEKAFKALEEEKQQIMATKAAKAKKWKKQNAQNSKQIEELQKQVKYLAHPDHIILRRSAPLHQKVIALIQSPTGKVQA